MPKWTDEDAEQVISAIENAGYEARSYSGRGMYGKTCLGVTLGPGQSVLEFAFDVLQETRPEEVSEVIDILRRPRQDSMGLGMILYWPDVPWPHAPQTQTASGYTTEHNNSDNDEGDE